MYKRPISNTRLLQLARPDRHKAGYVWWACGGDNWGLAPERGVIPVEVRRVLTGTVPNPPGCGGVWYGSEAEALRALQEAVAKLEGVAHAV